MEKSGPSAREPKKPGLDLSPPGYRGLPGPAGYPPPPPRRPVLSGLLVDSGGFGAWGQGRRRSLWHGTFDSGVTAGRVKVSCFSEQRKPGESKCNRARLPIALAPSLPPTTVRAPARLAGGPRTDSMLIALT